MACEILYTSDKRQVLMTKVINYIKKQDFEAFQSGLLISY